MRRRNQVVEASWGRRRAFYYRDSLCDKLFSLADRDEKGWLAKVGRSRVEANDRCCTRFSKAGSFQFEALTG